MTEAQYAFYLAACVGTPVLAGVVTGLILWRRGHRRAAQVAFAWALAQVAYQLCREWVTRTWLDPRGNPIREAMSTLSFLFFLYRIYSGMLLALFAVLVLRKAGGR